MSNLTPERKRRLENLLLECLAQEFMNGEEESEFSVYRVRTGEKFMSGNDETVLEFLDSIGDDRGLYTVRFDQGPDSELFEGVEVNASLVYKAINDYNSRTSLFNDADLEELSRLESL